MGQGDIVAFTTMLEKTEDLKLERSQIRKQAALHDKKDMNAYKRFGSPSPSFWDLEKQTEQYSDIAAKNNNQQGPSSQNNTLKPQVHNPRTNKTPNQNQQMSSKIFCQQMQKYKNTQRTTGGLIIDDNMRNIKDKKQLFQELRKQNNIQEKPKYVKPTNWEDVRA